MAMSDPYGWRFLAEQGLNLVAVLDTTTLPDAIQTVLRQYHLEPERYQRLVLVGNGGGLFWENLEASGRETAHPCDDFSMDLVSRWAQEYLDQEIVRLYPQTEMLIPLQQLGELAHWCHPSPLGSSISPQYGPWFAYRVAFITNAELPLKQATAQPSPCDSCLDKPCITACPVQAVQGIGRFQIKDCLSHRLRENSPCQDRCLSRLACPVAPQHRYPMAQIEHHYTFGREELRRYL